MSSRRRFKYTIYQKPIYKKSIKGDEVCHKCRVLKQIERRAMGKIYLDAQRLCKNKFFKSVVVLSLGNFYFYLVSQNVATLQTHPYVARFFANRKMDFTIQNDIIKIVRARTLNGSTWIFSRKL